MLFRSLAVTWGQIAGSRPVLLLPVEEQPHVIEVDETGWTIRCPVDQVATVELDKLDDPPVPPGRYECSLNDLGDRFLLLDRVDLEQA